MDLILALILDLDPCLNLRLGLDLELWCSGWIWAELGSESYLASNIDTSLQRNGAFTLKHSTLLGVLGVGVVLNNIHSDA